jgi:hypothetical protein
MALIAAKHINLLIENGVDTREIAYPSYTHLHNDITEEIFSLFIFLYFLK